MKFSISALLIITSIFLSSCGDDPFPRPRAYPRIDLPELSYQQFNHPGCDFHFEFPSTGIVSMMGTDSCAADIYFRNFDYYWHFTYRRFPGPVKRGRQDDDEYLKLVMKHAQKMDFLEELQLSGKNGHGNLYELKGKVGSPAQMIFGDSIHLLMVSTYFREAIDQDSLAPLIQVIKKDLLHLVETLHYGSRLAESTTN